MRIQMRIRSQLGFGSLGSGKTSAVVLGCVCCVLLFACCGSDPSEPPNDSPGSIDMVSLTGGTFQMGSTSSWTVSDEQPVHSVTLSSFSIAMYEVTNEEMREVMQWAYDNDKVNADSTTVMNAEGSARELLDIDDSYCEISFSGGTFAVDNGKEAHPCIEVTWYGAQAFCNYLSDAEGLERCISFSDWSCTWSANGYRLPTEAEWEYACRAGTTTDYYSGDETQNECSPIDPNLDAIGWYCGNDNGRTEEVGQKIRSDWGLYDLSGNVWEWCNDWYKSDYYAESSAQDPTGPTGGAWWVVRGGGWDSLARYCRSAARSGVSPGGSYSSLGFRPARR